LNEEDLKRIEKDRIEINTAYQNVNKTLFLINENKSIR
jgi:hypothetical protein